PGILRQHGRARRRSHPRLHPQSREGRSEAGADEPLALTSRLGRLQIQGAASATPSAASSGSNPKAPGFAGGYLLASYSGDFAAELHRQFRQVVQSAWYAELFPGTKWEKETARPRPRQDPLAPRRRGAPSPAGKPGGARQDQEGDRQPPLLRAVPA